MGNDLSYIKENLRTIRERVSEAADKYRTSGESIRIMAVTKTVAPEAVNYAVSLGLDLLGEYRVQEYLSKAESYDKSAEVHFIGHLQTNKVKYIIEPMTMIQSADSEKLIDEIGRLAVKNGKVMDILCEVNIGGEESKSGVSPENIRELLIHASETEGVRVRGLMTIPPPGNTDIFLGRMQELYNKLRSENINGINMDTLSMGMSSDYVEAVKYGSNILRIGTALFGARDYSK